MGFWHGVGVFVLRDGIVGVPFFFPTYSCTSRGFLKRRLSRPPNIVPVKSFGTIGSNKL